MPRNAAEPTLIITRVFDAEPSLVYRAFTDSTQLALWWGPEGFTAPVTKMDARVGGKFHLAMQAPDGQRYWNAGEILELRRNELIRWVMFFSDEQGNRKLPTDAGLGPDFPAELHDTITFEKAPGGKTLLTLKRNTPLSVSKKYREDIGWEGSLDKLDASLKLAP